MRHSKATVLDIEIDAHESGLCFSIRDDGAGFDVDAAKSHALAGGSIGLAGMQERVEFLNGTLEINSSRGGGTRIEVFLPSAPGHGGEIHTRGA
jgi:signal transduction histidine kinase